MENLYFQIDNFLIERLKLRFHSDKIIIKKYRQGIDFLGYVSFPHHRILRTKTKRRMLRKIKERIGELKQGRILEESLRKTTQSYFGVLKHCNSYKLKNRIKELLKK